MGEMEMQEEGRLKAQMLVELVPLSGWWEEGEIGEQIICG